MKNFLKSFIYLFSITLFAENNSADKIIEKTEERFKLINDYQVNMLISINIPAFRMPKKKYTVFFKQPDKVQIKSRGFGLLPRTGMFTSPNENFNNLTDIIINNESDSLGNNQIMLSGNLIVDSLAIKMPNDYAKLTFKPTVDVIIDTSQWVITAVVTKIDTLKIMENVHKNFCRKKEGKDFSYVHRDSDHPSIDVERETDDKGNPVLKK